MPGNRVLVRALATSWPLISVFRLGLWRVDEYSGTGTVWSRYRFQNREPSTCLFLLIRLIGACKQTGSCWNDRMFCCDCCCCCWGNFLLLIGAPARLHESWNSLVSLVHRPIDLRSAIAHIGKWKGAGTSLLSNLAHIEILHNNKMRIRGIISTRVTRYESVLIPTRVRLLQPEFSNMCIKSVKTC